MPSTWVLRDVLNVRHRSPEDLDSDSGALDWIHAYTFHEGMRDSILAECLSDIPSDKRARVVVKLVATASGYRFDELLRHIRLTGSAPQLSELKARIHMELLLAAYTDSCPCVDPKCGKMRHWKNHYPSPEKVGFIYAIETKAFDTAISATFRLLETINPDDNSHLTKENPDLQTHFFNNVNVYVLDRLERCISGHDAWRCPAQWIVFALSVPSVPHYFALTFRSVVLMQIYDPSEDVRMKLAIEKASVPLYLWDQEFHELSARALTVLALTVLTLHNVLKAMSPRSRYQSTPPDPDLIEKAPDNASEQRPMFEEGWLAGSPSTNAIYSTIANAYAALKHIVTIPVPGVDVVDDGVTSSIEFERHITDGMHYMLELRAEDLLLWIEDAPSLLNEFFARIDRYLKYRLREHALDPDSSTWRLPAAWMRFVIGMRFVPMDFSFTTSVIIHQRMFEQFESMDSEADTGTIFGPPVPLYMWDVDHEMFEQIFPEEDHKDGDLCSTQVTQEYV
ncbi:hypothetical protein PUNSTDRAFT_47674 [Punctularia strigosozonata HHB-11173 SS5]|uniref:Uncharacterized protein n=1 Tax=Punctularia strigosozonata (strain HHB-11173) TaxID=741275 RepID=R7S4H7_PUNST|nr:uncharacterized protein PUNSTDRAFT_47674 [Punctularia strigosozonata HHB-11173 SS5]EIN04151.1 hypothetical protein PUNSTDRAFT_47674 [Punctularia strigosozonata HHB-11173 SS5]